MTKKLLKNKFIRDLQREIFEAQNAAAKTTVTLDETPSAELLQQSSQPPSLTDMDIDENSSMCSTSSLSSGSSSFPPNACLPSFHPLHHPHIYGASPLAQSLPHHHHPIPLPAAMAAHPPSHHLSHQFPPLLSSSPPPHCSSSLIAAPASSTTSTIDASSNSTIVTKPSKRYKRGSLVLPKSCPLSKEEVIDLHIDVFNDFLARGHFTEDELTLLKDARRKGKNQVAARRSRDKRLQHVSFLKSKKNRASRDLQMLQYTYGKALKNLQVWGLILDKFERKMATYLK